jgi:GNAT superfamily N-acetyltransferase
MVMGIQNYYRIATNSNLDFRNIHRAVMTVLTNRLKTPRGYRLVKSGRTLTEVEQQRYGKSKMLRFLKNCEEPIYPIGYGKHKNPMLKKRKICQYTEDGRDDLHDNLRLNTSLMFKLMRQPLYSRSAEYADNRISLYSAQFGRCAVTGKEFQRLDDIHCHHKIPRAKGGDDKYGNLVLVLQPVHVLIHATQVEIIDNGISFYNLPPNQECPNGKIAYISNMFTYPEYRKQGIGSKLFELAIEEAKNNGCKKVLLDATALGRPIYERFGFKILRTIWYITLLNFIYTKSKIRYLSVFIIVAQ